MCRKTRNAHNISTPIFSQLASLNTKHNLRYILIKRYSKTSKVQIQSIDEIFNENVTNKEYYRSNMHNKSIGSININSLISKLDTQSSINDQLTMEISKHLKSNSNTFIKDTELLLECIANKASSDSVNTFKNNYESPQKIYGLMIEILQNFIRYHKLPNRHCIESMLSILLSLDVSKMDNSIIQTLYSLLQFSCLYCPVSFETYINVIEYASIQPLTESWTEQNRDDFIKQILRLLVKSKHRDQSGIARLASMYLKDYQPKAINDEINFVPSTPSTNTKQLFDLINQTQDGDILSMDKLSELYQNRYNEILPVQLVFESVLQTLGNIASSSSLIMLQKKIITR